MRGYLLTTDIEGAHPRHVDYPLFEGDLICRDEDGTFTKECPGLAMSGFVLTDDQIAAMTPVEFSSFGLNYRIQAVA